MKKSPFIYVICMTFLFNCLIVPVQAQELRLPTPGAMIHLSPAFNPSILKGIKVHPENPFKFEFVLGQGSDVISAMGPAAAKQEHQKSEANKLIKYFLAALTVPEKDLWVNLSPFEKDRIVPDAFGQTEMGRDLLAQDYLLKQITASLMHPDSQVGKDFWKKVYQETKKLGKERSRLFLTSVNLFNKVWIVPEKAVVYENAKAGTVYVVESRLKVMLEADYLALDKNMRAGDAKEGRTCQANERACLPAGRHQRDTAAAGPAHVASQVIREIVIPELTKEINEGRNFAQLRQVYNSLILATWYKKKIKDSILTQVYANKNKIKGTEYLTSVITPKPTRGHDPDILVGSRDRDPASPAGGPMPVAKQESLEGESAPGKPFNDVENIYAQYLQSFKKGAYNYIKEEQDPITQQMIPRKYFSGGASFTSMNMNQAMTTLQRVSPAQLNADGAMRVEVELAVAKSDPAMNDDFSAKVLRNWPIQLSINDQFILLEAIKQGPKIGASYTQDKIFNFSVKAGSKLLVMILKDIFKDYLVESIDDKDSSGGLKISIDEYVEEVRLKIRNAVGQEELAVQRLFRERLSPVIGVIKNKLREQIVDKFVNILSQGHLGFDFTDLSEDVRVEKKEHSLWVIIPKAELFYMSEKEIQGILRNLLRLNYSGRFFISETLDNAFKVSGFQTSSVDEFYRQLQEFLGEVKTRLNISSSPAMNSLAEEVKRLLGSTPNLKLLKGWRLDDDQTNLVEWLQAKDVMPEAGLFQRFLYNINTLIANGSRELAEGWVLLLQNKWGISKEKLMGVLKWMRQSNITIKDASGQDLMSFFTVFIESTQKYPNLRKAFGYILAPDLDVNTKLILAQKNIERMTKISSEDFIRNKVVLKAPIQGTKYFIGIEYGLVESTNGLSISLGVEKNGYNPLDGTFIRIGLDSEGDNLRINMIQGAFGAEQEINETFLETFGIHPALALLYIAGEIGSQGHLDYDENGFKALKSPFEKLMGIRPEFISTMKNGNPTLNLMINYNRLGLRTPTSFARVQHVNYLHEVLISNRIKRYDKKALGIFKMKNVFRNLRPVFKGSVGISNDDLSDDVSLAMLVEDSVRRMIQYFDGISRYSNLEDEGLFAEWKGMINKISVDQFIIGNDNKQREVSLFAVELLRLWKEKKLQDRLGSVFDLIAIIISGEGGTAEQMKSRFAWFYMMLEEAPVSERISSLWILVTSLVMHMRLASLHAETLSNGKKVFVDNDVFFGDHNSEGVLSRFVLLLIENPDLVDKDHLWALTLALDPTMHVIWPGTLEADVSRNILEAKWGRVSVESMMESSLLEALNRKELLGKRSQIISMVKGVLNISSEQWENDGYISPYKFGSRINSIKDAIQKRSIFNWLFNGKIKALVKIKLLAKRSEEGFKNRADNPWQEVLETSKYNFALKANEGDLTGIYERIWSGVLRKYQLEADNSNAMVSKGGIDFNPISLNLEAKKDPADTNAAPLQFNIDKAMRQRLQNAPGLMPGIINIEPMNDIKMFLGVND